MHLTWVGVTIRQDGAAVQKAMAIWNMKKFPERLLPFLQFLLQKLFTKSINLLILMLWH